MSNRNCATSSWRDTSSFTILVGIHLGKQKPHMVFLSFLFFFFYIWCYLQKGFYTLTQLQSIGRVGRKKKATMMPPRDYSTWEGAIYCPQGCRPRGRCDTRAPVCCTVLFPSQEVKACLLVADTPGLVPDAAESWSSSVAH